MIFAVVGVTGRVGVGDRFAGRKIIPIVRADDGWQGDRFQITRTARFLWQTLVIFVGYGAPGKIGDGCELSR